MGGVSKDFCVTLCPYFKITDGKKEEFMECVTKFFELIETETDLMFYGFTFTDDGRAHCREGYTAAAGVKTHLDSVGETFGKALQFSTLERIEVHGPASEVQILKEMQLLTDLGTIFYTLDERSVRRG